MEKSIGFIGGGRITNIFLQAFKNKNLNINNIFVYDIDIEVNNKLKESFSDIEISDLQTVVSKEIIFLAIHPPVFKEMFTQIKEFISVDSIIISLAPKISIKKLSNELNTENIVRLIPNASSVINQAYNPVCFSSDIKQKSEILELLSILGHTFETKESKLEAYAITSAMLPTYFWFQWYEMIEIAKKTGLTENESKETIEKSLIAALNTMFKSGLSKDQVIDLIPVKPIGEHENEIKEIYQKKLIPLFEKIKS